MIPVENAVKKTPRPVKVNGKWGFFREGESLVIDAVYESVQEYGEGLAAVSVEPWDNDYKRPPLYKIINEAGETVIPPFRGVPTSPIGFSCGMMLVLFVDYEKSRDISFHLDTDGNRHFEGIYESIGNFYNGLACVKVGGRYGFIDRSGNMVITPQFGKFTEFSEGFAKVTEFGSDRTGIIDTQGVYTLPFSQGLHLMHGVSEGIAIAVSSKGFYCIDPFGKRLFEDIYFPISLFPPFSEGMARYIGMLEDMSDQMVGYFSKDGVIHEPRFTYADDFSEGLCAVALKDDKLVYINKKCEEVIDVSAYTLVSKFKDGLAQVWLGVPVDPDSMTGYINKSGEVVWELTK